MQLSYFLLKLPQTVQVCQVALVIRPCSRLRHLIQRLHSAAFLFFMYAFKSNSFESQSHLVTDRKRQKVQIGAQIFGLICTVKKRIVGKSLFKTNAGQQELFSTSLN